MWDLGYLRYLQVLKPHRHEHGEDEATGILENGKRGSIGPQAPHGSQGDQGPGKSSNKRDFRALHQDSLERASLNLPSRDKVEDTGGPGYTWTGRFVRASRRGDGRTLGQADMGSWSYSYLAQTSIKSREQKPF